MSRWNKQPNKTCVVCGFTGNPDEFSLYTTSTCWRHCDAPFTGTPAPLGARGQKVEDPLMVRRCH